MASAVKSISDRSPAQTAIQYVLSHKPVTSAVPAMPEMSDSSTVANTPDSTTAITTAPAPTSGTYKFIIERTFNKGRALRRYNQLTADLIPIKMEKPDSSLFKLYFVLPSTPSDTSHIRDSLKNWYGRRVVYVEQ